MIGVAVQLGLGSGAAAAVELLSLPALYSAYHGLAYVRARGFQFEFSTDYTPGEVRFSWQPSAELTVPKIEPTPYADNGFSSYNAMAAAHATVLSACGQTNGTVIDLGCGDGTLLSKLWIRNSLLKCIGVESDKERAARGARRHPAVDFLVGKLEAFPIDAWGADAALLMPGRLLEIRADEFAPLLTRLRGIKKLIVYTYAGEDLGTLCSKSGLPLPSMLVKSGTTEAGVISWH
jgi:SAM-dependent methyltransferase